MSNGPVVPAELVEFQVVSARTLRVVVGGLPRSTLRKWIKAGFIPAPTPIGGSNYWRVSVIRAWLEKHFGGEVAAALEQRACPCAEAA